MVRPPGNFFLSFVGAKHGVWEDVGERRRCVWGIAVVAAGRRRQLLAADVGVEAGEQNRGEKREEKNRGSGMGLEVGR